MNYAGIVIKNKSRGADRIFLYSCGKTDVAIGDRVRVPFGRSNALKDGYAVKIYDSLKSAMADDKFLNEDTEIKEVESICEKAFISRECVEIALWIRERYFCKYIEAIELLFPMKPVRISNKKRYKIYNVKEREPVTLNKKQQEAFLEIGNAVEKCENKKFILEGVTASGKSEVYIKLIEKALDMGKCALILVPELMLTKQLVEKILSDFAYMEDEIAIFHSGLKGGEKYEQYCKIESGAAKIAIGARSILHLPMKNLGIIIVDEEHAQAYKSDKTPKYDGVEVAIRLSEIYDVPIVCASATPSMDRIFRWQNGEFHKIIIDERYNGNSHPQICVVNMAQELKAGNKSVFSRKLYDSMWSALQKGRQIMLFIENSGSYFVSCRSCGHVEKCHKCGVAMVYHEDSKTLKCRYCGRKNQLKVPCEKCASPYIKKFGIGIKKLYEETQKMFPNAKITVLDLDESKALKDISDVLDGFERGNADIIIGNRAISKGIDFKNVSLVGIVAMDSLLNSFDYRGGEKAFQSVVHSSGRAGRGEAVGEVVLQTYEPEHYAIEYAKILDLEGFYKREMSFRRMMCYPPFGYLTQITFACKDQMMAEREFSRAQKLIKKELGQYSVVGTRFERSSDDNKMYKYHILAKYGRDEEDVFRNIIEGIKGLDSGFGYDVHLTVDVNPKRVWRN